MAGFTSSTLINDIKVRAAVPIAQETFTEEDILGLANDDLRLELVPLIMSVKEEFYTTKEYITLVANQSNYQIPYRAIGSKLRTVEFIDGNGNIYDMARIQPENKSLYSSNAGNNTPLTFYLENNEIVLVSGMNADPNGQLVLGYYLRPNDLVMPERIGVIQNIDRTTGAITVAAYPSNITNGNLVDFCQVKSGNKILAFDVPVTGTNSTPTVRTISVDPSLIPDSLLIGDHICSAGECMIPQIPTDLHVVLSQSTACRILEAIGDSQGLENANKKLDRMVQKTLMLIDTRTEGNPQKIFNKGSQLLRNVNRGGFRRSGKL